MAETTLHITVVPRSAKSAIELLQDGSVRVHLHAPPAEGKANAECVQLFAKVLHTAKSNIRIDKGEKGRRKRLVIEGMSQDEVLGKIKNAT